MHLPKFLRFLVKPTSDSKNPTDQKLDEAIEKLEFYLPSVYKLLRYIFIGKIKRFLRYEWKYFLLWLIIISGISTGAFLFAVKIVEPIIIKPKTQIVEKEIYIRQLKPYSQFVIDVAQKESGGRYNIVNQFGMLGAFQFHPGYLKTYVGINVSKEDFLNNPELQRGAFKQLLLNNYRTFNTYINKWNFKQIKNVKGTVTASGILMAFHLRPESAKTFFDSNGNDLGVPDGNGVTVNKYIELFSGYELPF